VDGRTHWLALDPEPLADAEAWIEWTRAFWDGRLHALASMLRDEPQVAPERRP
jgi:hypothetical protein